MSTPIYKQYVAHKWGVYILANRGLVVPPVIFWWLNFRKQSLTHSLQWFTSRAHSKVGVYVPRYVRLMYAVFYAHQAVFRVVNGHICKCSWLKQPRGPGLALFRNFLSTRFPFFYFKWSHLVLYADNVLPIETLSSVKILVPGRLVWLVRNTSWLLSPEVWIFS